MHRWCGAMIGRGASWIGGSKASSRCCRFLRSAAVWTNCLVAFAFLLSALFRSSKTGKWVVLHRGRN